MNKKKDTGKKTEIRNSNTHINNFFLVFDNWQWMSQYVRQHDPLYKWCAKCSKSRELYITMVTRYIVCSFVILTCMGGILILTSYNTRWVHKV